MTHFFRIALFTVALGFAPGFIDAAHAQTTVAQQAPVADLQLRGVLAGGNVASASGSPATGEVAAVLTADGILRLDIIYTGLADNATGAALHVGKINENGRAVQALAIATNATQGRLVDAKLSLSRLDAARIRAGESYISIATIVHPDGAIRAQLIPQPTRLGELPKTEREPEED